MGKRAVNEPAVTERQFEDGPVVDVEHIEGDKAQGLALALTLRAGERREGGREGDRRQT